MSSSVETLFKDNLIWLAESCQAQVSKPCRQGASFGLKDVNSNLPFLGLQFGAIHEFFYAPKSPPPLSLISLLLSESPIASSDKFIFWIGKQICPTPFVLNKTIGPQCLDRCVFVDPPSLKLSPWSAEQALSSSAVGATIVALKDITLTATKRFSLAAQKGAGIGLIVCPFRAGYLKFLPPSHAASRWLLTPVKSEQKSQLVKLELLKVKGAKPCRSEWILEIKENEKLSLHISEELQGAKASSLGTKIYAAGGDS